MTNSQNCQSGKCRQLLQGHFNTEATCLISYLWYQSHPRLSRLWPRTDTCGGEEHELPSQLVCGTAIRSSWRSSERQLCLAGDTPFTHTLTRAHTNKCVHAGFGARTLKLRRHVHMNTYPANCPLPPTVINPERPIQNNIVELMVV